MSQQQRTASAFLTKTYDMVNDYMTNDVICWGTNGNSFVVVKQTEFARDLLPRYFKHNNFSSFVRQLNTYGFRKMASDKWEFANENFKRGHKELLPTIKRQKSQSIVAKRSVGVYGNSTSNPGLMNMGSTSTGSRSMERNTHLINLSSENENLKKENEKLKSELTLVKKQCDRLIAFLRDNVNVGADQINGIIRQGTSGSNLNSARSGDGVEGEGKSKGGKGVKLFGVLLNGENADGNGRKRGYEEIIGSENKEMNN